MEHPDRMTAEQNAFWEGYADAMRKVESKRGYDRVVQVCEQPPSNGHSGVTTVLTESGRMFCRNWTSQQWRQDNLPVGCDPDAPESQQDNRK